MPNETIPENPSAFPKQPTMHMPHGVTTVTEQGGMTLRDYFAAATLATADRDAPVFMVAREAYAIADAMLVERAKGGK